MTAAAPTLPAILGPIRPRARWRETQLLLIVAAAILVGSISLDLTRHVADPGSATGLHPANPLHLAVYLGLLAIAHIPTIGARNGTGGREIGPTFVDSSTSSGRNSDR